MSLPLFTPSHWSCEPYMNFLSKESKVLLPFLSLNPCTSVHRSLDSLDETSRRDMQRLPQAWRGFFHLSPRKDPVNSISVKVGGCKDLYKALLPSSPYPSPSSPFWPFARQLASILTRGRLQEFPSTEDNYIWCPKYTFLRGSALEGILRNTAGLKGTKSLPKHRKPPQRDLFD